MHDTYNSHLRRSIEWHLAEAGRLTRALGEDAHGPSSRPATQQDLIRIERTLHNIMSAISDFAARQNAFNDRQAAAIDGVIGDVAFLVETIEKLQNTPGAITPEDQALLDALDARASTIADKLEALDAQTPPKPPVEPPPGPTEPPTEPAPTT